MENWYFPDSLGGFMQKIIFIFLCRPQTQMLVPALQWIPTTRNRSRLSEVNYENPTLTEPVKNGDSLQTLNPFLDVEESLSPLPTNTENTNIENTLQIDKVDDLVHDNERTEEDNVSKDNTCT